MKNNHFFSSRKKYNNVKYIIFYVFLTMCWIVIIALCSYFFLVRQFYKADLSLSPVVVKIIMILNFLFLSLLYCDGFKNFCFVIMYYISYAKKQILPKNDCINEIYKSNKIISKKTDIPKVLLLYTTRNDFDENSLLCSMNQEYENYSVYILDDSDDKSYIEKVNNFVERFESGVYLIRRNNNKGFKAGNLNNFLKNYKSYDYFVLLDSDEIIPKDFISKSLMYFKDNKNIGIVQANHTSNRYTNSFEKSGAIGVFSGASTSLTMREIFGIPTLYGHGAIISKECYENVGGFPEIVSEDIGFLIDALYIGYEIAFAKNIICDEKFPIDYLSFKKRSIKWTQGNCELFKKKWKKIIKLPQPFWKKLDLWMNITSISFSVMSFFVITLNFTILYPLNFSYDFFPIWIVFIVIFMIVPFLNQILYFILIDKKRWWLFIRVIIFNYFLFPSLLITSCVTVIFSIFGKKAKFIVTPKKSKKYSLKDAIKYSWLELIFAIALIIFFIFTYIYIPNIKNINFIWLFLVILPMISSPLLILMSNKKIYKIIRKEKKYES